MDSGKIIKKMNKHRLEILLLVGITLIAFGVYSVPSETYPSINEFDPFYHARVVRELVTTGSIPEWEYMSYWPEGMPMNSLYPHLWHYLLAVAYWGAALLTTGSFAYSEPLFVKVVSWVMPFVGAFGVAAMYLLGREIRNKKAGLFAALLFLFNGNFLYKTMFAEIEEDAFGISLFVFSLFAYVYALKRGGWKNALFAGLAISALLLAWRGVVYAGVIVGLVALWHGLKAIINKEHATLEQITEVLGLSLVPIAVLGFLFDPIQQDVIYLLGVLGGTTTLLVIANYWINYYKGHRKARVFGMDKKKAYQAAVALLVLASLAAGVMYGNKIINKTISALTLGQTNVRLYHTVAENHPVSFESVIAGLGLLGVFGLFALAYFPVKTLLKWKNLENYDVLVTVFLLSSLMFYMSQNKMLYFFAPASALAIGIVLADLIRLAGKLGNWLKHIAVIGVLALLFTQALIGFASIEQMKANYPVQNGWFKAMDWLETTPEDTAFLTWWDYGHWTAFLGNRHAIVDNTNINHTKVEQVANIFTEYRANTTDELEARILPQLKAFKVTHVGVDRILLYSKWGALTYIANRQCIPTKNLDAIGLSFPQLADVSKQICGYGYTYAGEVGIAPCQKKSVFSDFGNDEYVSCSFIQGADVQFSPDEWQEIVDAPWPGYPLTISDAEGNSLSVRVYGQPDYRIMFFHANKKLLFDAPINYMYGFRVFFKDPNFKHHELVQNEWVPNEEVVVQKVIY